MADDNCVRSAFGPAVAKFNETTPPKYVGPRVLPREPGHDRSVRSVAAENVDRPRLHDVLRRRDAPAARRRRINMILDMYCSTQS